MPQKPDGITDNSVLVSVQNTLSQDIVVGTLSTEQDGINNLVTIAAGQSHIIQATELSAALNIAIIFVGDAKASQFFAIVFEEYGECPQSLVVGCDNCADIDVSCFPVTSVQVYPVAANNLSSDPVTSATNTVAAKKKKAKRGKN